MSGVADEATNAGSGSQSLTVQYDGTGPGVTIALATGYTAPVNGAFGFLLFAKRSDTPFDISILFACPFLSFAKR